MTTTFSEQLFESKLVNLKDSQEAVNALSSWCLQNRDHHKKIVNCWLHCLKRVKIEQRLSLFYLANDVIQYSKRKHYQFVESWGTALQKATTLVRDDKVKNRVMRIFKIWEERGVYDEAFISDLCGLLTTNIKKKVEPSNDTEFQPTSLVTKIRECKTLEDETDLRFRRVKDNQLPLNDADSLRNSLKDRRQGSDIYAEVDQGVKKMEGYVKALEREIGEREKLVEMLLQAASFYEIQRGEAKIVCNAYRNFGGKVKSLKRKLDELIPTLSVESPLPSPDVNAPSPSPDSDLELPSKTAAPNSAPDNGIDVNFTSFMGNPQFFELQKDVLGNFNSNSNDTGGLRGETGPRAIEVINTRDHKHPEGDFNITDFIKSLLPGKAEPLKPPPMPPAPFPSPWGAEPPPAMPLWSLPPPSPPPAAPWPMPPLPAVDQSGPKDWNTPETWPEPMQPPLMDTPESPPLYEKEAVSTPVEYDDSVPVPPLPDVDHRTLMAVPPTADMDHRLAPHDVDHRPPVQPKLSKLAKDIDHRNLISLTGSPRERPAPLPPPPAFVWPSDRDYRDKPADMDFRVPPPKVEDRKDNVESIDMDVSEEEEDAVPIQLRDESDDIDDRLFGSMETSFLDRSAAGGPLPLSHDVDERLQSLFGGPKPPEGETKADEEHAERSEGGRPQDGDCGQDLNGFDEDCNLQGDEWTPSDSQIPGPGPGPFHPGPAPSQYRGPDFRMRWNVQRGPRGPRGGKPRYPFRPPLVRPDMRGRGMPFRGMRPRLHGRGRW